MKPIDALSLISQGLQQLKLNRQEHAAIIAAEQCLLQLVQEDEKRRSPVKEMEDKPEAPKLV